MADSTITVGRLFLVNNWGEPNPAYGLPADGLIGVSHHNVVAAAYPLGTVIKVPNVTIGNVGFSFLAYLKAVANAAVAFAAGEVCVPDAVATGPCVVTNDPDDCIQKAGSLAAICLSAMTTLYYGWFWVGGVCPQDVALFNNVASPLTTAATIPTDDSVVAGAFTTVDLAADAIGLGVMAATALPFGFALGADGA